MTKPKTATKLALASVSVLPQGKETLAASTSLSVRYVIDGVVKSEGFGFGLLPNVGEVIETSGSVAYKVTAIHHATYETPGTVVTYVYLTTQPVKEGNLVASDEKIREVDRTLIGLQTLEKTSNLTLDFLQLVWQVMLYDPALGKVYSRLEFGAPLYDRDIGSPALLTLVQAHRSMTSTLIKEISAQAKQPPASEPILPGARDRQPQASTSRSKQVDGSARQPVGRAHAKRSPK